MCNSKSTTQNVTLADVTPIEGEVRALVQCVQCHHIFVCRYIPYSMDPGATFDPCLCWCLGSSYTTLEIVQD